MTGGLRVEGRSTRILSRRTGMMLKRTIGSRAGLSSSSGSRRLGAGRRMQCGRYSFSRSVLTLVGIWTNTNSTFHVSTIRYLAELGRGLFVAVIGTQLTLVLLAAPAATAGSICLDRARGTLLHMLMTDLSAAEIVLGKLAGRLVPVLALLACTLAGAGDFSPCWGASIRPALLEICCFVVTVGVAVLGCSLVDDPVAVCGQDAR